MTERQRLPNRRDAEVREFELDGVHYIATASRFDDGSIAEIFLDGPKPGSGAQIAARDAAIVTSMALQLGVSADALLHSLERNRDGSPRGPIGRALAAFGQAE
jgi:hypothetical protein